MIGAGRDENDAGLVRTPDRIGQRTGAGPVIRAQAQVHQRQPARRRPIDGRDERPDGRVECPVEHLQRTNVDRGRQILDGRGNRSAVAQAVHGVVMDVALAVEAGASRNRADVRMAGMDAAVDHPDDERLRWGS